MDKFVIMYNTGVIETCEKIDKAVISLIEKRLINFIFDCKENIVKALDENGNIKDIKVNHLKNAITG